MQIGNVRKPYFASIQDIHMIEITEILEPMGIVFQQKKEFLSSQYSIDFMRLSLLDSNFFSVLPFIFTPSLIK